MPIKKSRATAWVGKRREQLCALLAEGVSPKAACFRLGFSYHTYCSWMLQGSGDDAPEPYRSFYLAVGEAKFAGRAKTPPQMRKGRKPGPISAAQQLKVFEAVRLGFTYHEVAKHAGIRLSTLLSWLRLGGHPHARSLATKPLHPLAVVDPYKRFAEEVMALEHGERT